MFLFLLQRSSDVSHLNAKQLNAILKAVGKTLKGKKQHKMTLVCELLDFSGVNTDSFLHIITKLRNTNDGWTKDICNAPGVTMAEVENYLLRCYNPVTHTISGDFEVFSAENLRLYEPYEVTCIPTGLDMFMA